MKSPPDHDSPRPRPKRAYRVRIRIISTNFRKFMKKDVTFLPKKVLQEVYPTQSTVDIVLLKHCTDFFLGLNAGRWLMLRMSELCEKSSKFLINEEKTNIDTNVIEEVKFQTLLNNSGISWDPTENTEDPEPDQAYLFHHYNLSGNGGISGQKIIVHHDDDL